MAIGWYIVPYKRLTGASLPMPTRYCAMGDHTATIHAAGGAWSEVEVLGNQAIVKVRATPAVLTQLNGVAGFRRLPKDLLDDSLASLSTGVKTAIRNELTSAGYTLAEVQARFGSDIGQYTLRDVLNFFASRRLKPRYDAGTDTIILDGAEQDCKDIDELDGEVV